MAVPGLMGGDVPDWLADWLTGQGFLSSNSQTSAPNGLLQQSKAIFDYLGKKPKEIFPQDNEGGSPVGDPEPINFETLTPDQIANVINTGFVGGNWGPGANMLGIASAIMGKPATLLGAFGRGINMLEGINQAKSMEQRDKDFDIEVHDPEGSDYDDRQDRSNTLTNALANRGYEYGYALYDDYDENGNPTKNASIISVSSKPDNTILDPDGDPVKQPLDYHLTPKGVRNAMKNSIMNRVGKVTGLFDTSTYSPTLGYSDKQIEEARKMGLEGIDPSPDKGQSRHPSSPSSYTIQPPPVKVLEQVINEIGPPINLTPRSETFKGPDIFNPVIDKGYKDYTSQKAIADRNRGLWDALVREDYHRDPRNENPWGPYGSGGNIHKSPYVETFQKLAPKQKAFAVIPIEEGPVESIVNNNITLSDIYSSEDERAMQQEIVNEMLGDNMGGFGGEGIGDDYTGWT